jgi:hypothetical protein
MGGKGADHDTGNDYRADARQNVAHHMPFPARRRLRTVTRTGVGHLTAGRPVLLALIGRLPWIRLTLVRRLLKGRLPWIRLALIGRLPWIRLTLVRRLALIGRLPWIRLTLIRRLALLLAVRIPRWLFAHDPSPARLRRTFPQKTHCPCYRCTMSANMTYLRNRLVSVGLGRLTTSSGERMAGRSI